MTSAKQTEPTAGAVVPQPQPTSAPSAQWTSLLPSADLLLRMVLVMLTVLAVVRWCISIIANGAAYLGTYDFSFYYDAALAYRANIHANIYDPHVLRAAADAHHVFLGVGVYQYPPLLPIAFIPFTFISFESASRVWMGLNVLMWLGGTVLLASLLRRALYGAEPPALRAHVVAQPDPRSAAGLGERLLAAWRGLSTVDLFAIAMATFISLTYAPLLQSITLGQASMSIFFLFVLSAWLLYRGLPGWAGVALGLATMSKLLPIVVVAYFVLRGNWRVVAGAVATMAALLLGMAAVLGVNGVLAMRAIPSNGAGDSMRYQNEALSRMPMWIAVALGGHPSQLLLDIGYGLIGIVSLVFAGAVVYVSRRGRPAKDAEPPNSGALGRSVSARRSRVPASNVELLGYGWALCTLVLVSPIYWEHHAAWLLPAFLVCLGYVLRQLTRDPAALRNGAALRNVAMIVIALLIAGYVLTMNDLPFAYDTNSAYSIGPTFLHEPLRPFFMLMRPLGTLLLWAASGVLFWRLGLGQDPALPSPRPGEPQS